MEYRPIEVKLMCARDLKDVNVFSTMDVYVIGSISGDPKSMQRTHVDKDGGINPKWNYEMKFAVDESAAKLNRLGLVFQIMSDRTLGDKEVGRVYVPLKELFEAAGVGEDCSSGEALGEERQLMYQVQTPSGKFKGQLEFTFKLGERFIQTVDRKLDEPVMAYPAAPGHIPGRGNGYPGQGGFGTGPMPLPCPSSYPGPSGSAPYEQHKHGPHGQYNPGYQPHGYRHGYGYSNPPPPNPPMGYGYAYPGPAPGGYPYPGQPGPPGYAPQVLQQVQRPGKPKKNKFGLGAGAAAGIGAGLLGGLLVGEMVEDVAEASAFDAIYDDY